MSVYLLKRIFLEFVSTTVQSRKQMFTFLFIFTQVRKPQIDTVSFCVLFIVWLTYKDEGV